MPKVNKSSEPQKIQDSFLKEIINSNLKGQEIIKFIAKSLPQKPGVYQMENEKGDILYIGKAKNLAKRVVNYSSLNSLTRRLQRMVSLTKHVNFVVTNTEVEALLLECNLIKRYKPRFNIILRDDKSFPYILINKEYDYPRIQKYRGSKKFKGDYYGPFVSPSVADYTLLALQKTFLLRSCADSIFNNRKRPCLLYDIKRCSAPCVEYISKENYSENIKDAKKFFSALKLTNKDEWNEYSKSNQRPSDIPSTPTQVYKKEWKGWGDFLGTGRIANQDMVYLSAKEAKPVLKKLFKEYDIKNLSEWERFAKTHSKLLEELHIPSKLLRTYSLENANRKSKK